MPFYSRGSVGPEVVCIQRRLAELGFYLGPVDGVFGGGTEGAVRAFQAARRAAVDGVVGKRTWKLLFKEAIPAPVVASEPVERRTLTLTGCFETGAPPPECFAGLSGDFDGQGISFGALQWNLGQGSLQPLLQRMHQRHPEVLEATFNTRHGELMAVLSAGRSEQLEWARTLQTPRHTLVEPWQGMFRSLGRRPEFQRIQLDAAAALHRKAKALCARFHVRSERALALMFDIVVQNGGISAPVEAQILHDFARIQGRGDVAEMARMEAVARRRSAASHPRWVADVLARKLTIATGKGSVHGRNYNLEEQFGLTLRRLPGLDQ